MLFVAGIIQGVYLLWSLCTGVIHGNYQRGVRGVPHVGISRFYRSENPKQYWATYIWCCIIDAITFFWDFRHWR
jgi:hypothetical protein